MKILFISDNFYPEVNAPAIRTFENCKVWVNQGHDVTVITCFPNFPGGKLYKGYSNKLYSIEIIEGIRVVRVWSFIAPNKGFFKRIVDYTSFALSSLVFGTFIKCDVIIATSPQFFTAISGFILSKLKFRPWIMEVRDLWPDSILAVGYFTENDFIYKFLKKVEHQLYKSSNVIISLTESFKHKFISIHKINRKKIGVFKNGIDKSSIIIDPLKIEKIKKELKIDNKIVISYVGTIGMAHGLDFIVNSISKLKNLNIKLIIIGEGSERESLKNQVENLKISNILFIDRIPKNEIYNYIKLSDLALVNLKKNDEFKNVIPSKIFENIALEKPILLGVEGEAKELIEKYGVGVAFEPENDKEFHASIEKALQLKSDSNFKENCINMINDFDRLKIAKDMISFIENKI